MNGKEILQSLMAGALIAAWFSIGAIYGMKQTQPDLNTVTIHKTQDRLPVACQEGAQ
jgi:hypothetical protein